MFNRFITNYGESGIFKREDKQVAVTGIGALCATGLDFESAIAALFEKRREPAAPRRFQLEHPITYPVFELPLSPLDDEDEKQPWLRTSRLALTAAREALNRAGWCNDGESNDIKLSQLKVGVCVGTTVGGTMNNEKFYRDYRDRKNPSLEPIDRYLRSNPAAVLAQVFDLHGPQLTIVNACASGTDAIGIGAGWIKSGICDLVLTGGSDELCRVTCNGFISLMISAQQACRPFDQQRNGLNLGEGAAILVLESDKLRKLRNRPAQAFIAGYGSSCDAWHLTAPHPEGKGLRQALQLALNDAGSKAEEISFINAHGTATANNDLTEGKILKSLFPQAPFFSTKGHTGHTLGAAGALEAAFTIAMLQSRKIPASAGFGTIDPEISHAPTECAQNINGRLALSQSLAFGGNNAALVISLDGARQ
ncbi:MAG: beta-ketoacyl-[acyl-carrier-protein] synthase family protein [Pseudomonadota bacterium]|nr:beta-ketoacyl-[acyl-carrier-protein] synthase family protein [Pseudomonadota bacterium]